MFGQKTYKNETGWNVGAEWTDNVVIGQHRGKICNDFVVVIIINYKFIDLLLFLLLLLLQVDCPFIVCMTYAFHTPDKLCFILDLMNGGDLHYHLSQHGVFNEAEMKFYAAEVSLLNMVLKNVIPCSHNTHAHNIIIMC